MKERIRARWFSKWTCFAAGLVLAAVGAGIVVAEPVQKKAGTGSPPAAKTTNSAAGAEAPASPRVTASGDAVVARVNGEEITYKALAEECIARKGAEVLDTMVSKMLVVQACKASGIKITAKEIDDEVGHTAERLKMNREQYLKMLQTERGLTYKRFAEDVLWPGLALKKLAKPGVKVTEDDIERGFEAHYGEKVKCRWITLDNIQNAMKVWNELKTTDKNGKIELAEFERRVTRWSTDQATQSIGGQLQPISRHTSPAFQQLEEAAFNLKEDGEISKVVQFGSAYVILYREGYIPPADVKLENVRPLIEEEIYETKLRDKIGQLFQGLQHDASIENLLTGEVSSPDKKTTVADSPEKPKREPVDVGSKEAAPKKGAPAIKK